MPKLVLVDGHSLAYRAYHALPPALQTSAGELTNASFGFTSMLLTVLEEERPDYVVVAFDKGPSFRVREYAEYKAHRSKMPDEMRVQMAWIREIVEAFGIPIVELEDYEADDVLGTLACQGRDADLNVVIVTGDRDALQLVNERVTVFTSGRRFSDVIRYTPEKVRERYELEPEQLIDLKALLGDKSDNIPGVRGVGEKGGTKLLKKYGDLEGIYDHLEEISTRYRNALVKARDVAFLSRKLGRIVCDAPVELDLERAQSGRGYDRDRVLELMQRLELRSLVSRVPAGPAEPAAHKGEQLSLFSEEEGEEELPSSEDLGCYHLVADEATLEELAELLREARVVTVDTETTGLRSMQADLVGISITDRDGEAWYLPVMAPPGEKTLDLALVQQHLGPILVDPEVVKQGHNLKYDLKVLERHGMPMRGTLFDTMIAEWVINPDSPNLGLKNLSWARLGIQMTEITELIGTGRNQKTMAEVQVVEVVPYACADVDVPHRLARILRPELEEREQLALLRDLEMPLLPILAEMERTGVKLDTAWLQELSEELAGRLSYLEQEIYHYADAEFNVNSPQQLSEVLFDQLCLPARGVRKTKSGYYSTRAEVLDGLLGEHPIIQAILDYRELAKLKSTYVDALPELVNPETGRVHTSYNQTGTVTGRISSTNPNLQNIPIRSEEGRRVRRAFVAEEGWRLVGADYSQVELRVVAHISGDRRMIEAFERGEDIHASTAAAVYGVPIDEVTYDMRRVAKSVNFGLIYGQSAYGLARELGMTPEDADAFIKRYFERFPGVEAYMQRVQQEVAEKGYVETLMNRRRYFPELGPGSRASRGRRQVVAMRMAINAPIQGTAADIIKLAMLRLDRALKERGSRARMLLQVHDEIVLEVPKDEVKSLEPLICEAMENAFDLVVPLNVEVEIGQNWEEMK